MPEITNQAPAAVAADIAAPGAYPGATIPAKRPGANLPIAIWNIRAFGSLTREWTADASDSPKRDLRGLPAIGEIIRRFDVVAVQKVKGNLRPLRDPLWLPATTGHS